MEGISLRVARLEDAEALVAIYAPYIEKTAITFEYTVPSVEEFRNRMKATQAVYPYLVVEKDDHIIGYCYVGAFKARRAYDWSVETSIYLALDMQHGGVGRFVYEQLEKVLNRMGVINVYACITSPIVEDEYLTRNSIEFHKALGYTFVGEFKKCGYKFDRWYNVVWMEKCIGEHTVPVEPFRPFEEKFLTE